MWRLLPIAGVVFALGGALAGDTSVTVQTKSGPVRGVARNRSAYFKGIPFAQPPVGDLRWRPPQPVNPWSSPLDASQFQRSCIQAANDNMGYPQPTGSLSEDCLYLNVYSPPITGRGQSDLLPVIFWIYGGGFQGGGGNETRLNGTWDVELFQDEVVIVTHNYRLGVFGFLASDDLRSRDTENNSTGNYGIQDQRAAMKWVHENIAAFGGDPTRVLIVGQSAGANSVSQHLVRPASWPYFSAAGMESGAFYDSWTLTTGVSTVADLNKEFDAMLKKVGCDSTGSDGVACLVGKPTQDVFRATGRWTPSVDGVELPAPGPVLASKGTLARVPTFAGYVSEDISTMACCGENCTQLEFTMCAKMTYSLSEAEATEMTTLYSDEMVPPGQSGSKWFWAAKHAGADNWAGCPARRMARWTTANGQKGYYYRWSHTAFNPADGGEPGHAHHALEQPFVFHVLSETAEEIAEDNGKYFIYPQDEPLSRAIVSYWLSMARDGSPSPGASIGSPWPAWTESTGEGLVIGDTPDFVAVNISAAPALRKAKCDLFDKIFMDSTRVPNGGALATPHFAFGFQ